MRIFLGNRLGGSNEPFLNKPARFTELSETNAVRGGKNKNTLFLELQEFADNCNNQKKYRIKNSEAAHNVKVMEAIVKSSKKNKKIYI